MAVDGAGGTLTLAPHPDPAVHPLSWLWAAARAQREAAGVGQGEEEEEEEEEQGAWGAGGLAMTVGQPEGPRCFAVCSPHSPCTCKLDAGEASILLPSINAPFPCCGAQTLGHMTRRAPSAPSPPLLWSCDCWRQGPQAAVARLLRACHGSRGHSAWTRRSIRRSSSSSRPVGRRSRRRQQRVRLLQWRIWGRPPTRGWAHPGPLPRAERAMPAEQVRCACAALCCRRKLAALLLPGS